MSRVNQYVVHEKLYLGYLSGGRAHSAQLTIMTLSIPLPFLASPLPVYYMQAYKMGVYPNIEPHLRMRHTSG